ncbi:MAG: hypothetical protein ACRDRP_06665 [Pseudonocardiaceae bacterium]
MRDLTGGDALAVAEISTARQLILAQPDPDLTSLALLAVELARGLWPCVRAGEVSRGGGRSLRSWRRR